MREMSSPHYKADDYRRILTNNYNGLVVLAHKTQKVTQHLELICSLLAVSYLAIQSIILSFVFQKSDLPCQSRFTPFYLSIIIAVLFGVNMSATISKYLNVTYEQDQNRVDQMENYVELVNLDNCSGKDGACDLQGVNFEIKYSDQSPGPDMFIVYKRYAHVGTTGMLLVAYTALVLHACHYSSCQ